MAMKITQPGSEPILNNRTFRGTLPDGRKVALKSESYGFSITGDPTMAGHSSGRFDSGDMLQLADGALAEAITDTQYQMLSQSK